VGVASTSAGTAAGNQAYGLAAATSLNGASSRPTAAAYSAGATPSRARRAMSNTGNVSHAWNTSCATSAGWNGASNGNGGGSASRWLQASRSPALRARRRVSSASAPAITATS
jgi:hypothetical protein